MDSTEQRRVHDMAGLMRVKPGARVRLPHDFDPGFRGGYADHKEAEAVLARDIAQLSLLQDKLAAQNTYALLVVLQALDAAGKDGTVKHVMSGVNPQGVSVHSFKVPSDQELEEDYLRRYAVRLPARGEIGIFNRSHYEEVLVVRVHPELLAREHLPPQAEGRGFWRRRFRDINAWEQYLVDNGIRLVKFFLNVSREEQRKRFLARLETPDKNWKFSVADLRERTFWDDYQKAYSEMLSSTSTEWAPWYVIPADHKWFSHLAVGAILVHELMRIGPKYPEVGPQQREELRSAEAQLRAEG